VPNWRIMVIYEIESDNIAATMAQIPRAIRTPAMPISDAIDMSTALRLLGCSVSPRFEKA
jgi:hypothetical protein